MEEEQVCELLRLRGPSLFFAPSAPVTHLESSGPQAPPRATVHLHHCASCYISFLLFFPKGERATFGLSQGQVMISDSISPKHMACPGKLSQFPKIW